MSISNFSRLIQMRDTKANVEALNGTFEEAAFAYATDTGQLGIYTNSSWVWFSSGTSQNICGTYQRSGQPTPLIGVTGSMWQVPDKVYASGSLSVFLDGLAQTTGVDYEEFLWVSGTYRYINSLETGTVHMVMYGVPCIAQTQPSTGNANALLDSDNVLLLDSDGIQLLDSDG